MQHTQNYQLSRWEKDDRIMMEDFNADNEAIDAALKANADAVGALEVGKADAAALSALQTALGSGGHNCRIAWGSYVGTGTYGSSSPNTLTFDFTPTMLFIGTGNNTTCLMRPMPTGSCIGASGSMILTWADNSVSWYSDPNNYYADSSQCNNKNVQYYWISFGYNAA